MAGPAVQFWSIMFVCLVWTVYSSVRVTLLGSSAPDSLTGIQLTAATGSRIHTLKFKPTHLPEANFTVHFSWNFQLKRFLDHKVVGLWLGLALEVKLRVYGKV